MRENPSLIPMYPQEYVWTPFVLCDETRYEKLLFKASYFLFYSRWRHRISIFQSVFLLVIHHLLVCMRPTRARTGPLLLLGFLPIILAHLGNTHTHTHTLSKILMSGFDFDTRYWIVFYIFPNVLLSFGDDWLYFSIYVKPI